MAAQQWWVQIDQAMLGPMAPSELRALARHRKIGVETLVSSDKVRWVPARSLKGLFVPAHEKADTKPREQAGANSAGRVSRSVAAPVDDEAGKEQPAGHHTRPRADEFAPRFPVLRTRSRFLWNDTVAIYDSHVLQGRRYWRRLAITEPMCHADGEPALRGQFHRESRIEFNDVREVREITPSRKGSGTGSCHFAVRSKHRRRIRFTLPALQAEGPRAALSLRLADRYWIRTARWRDGFLGSLLILVGIAIGGVGLGLALAFLRSGTAIAEIIGAVGAALGTLCGAWGFYRLTSGKGWTKINEYAPQDLESAHQPKRTAPTRRSPFRSKSLGWTLKLFGLAYWLAIASPLHDRLPGIVDRVPGLVIVLWAPAPILIFTGYRLCQHHYQPGQSGDDRKPVLFLRPFDDDMATSLQPSGILSQLAGLRVGWLSGASLPNFKSSLATQALFNSYPIRLVRTFFDYGTDSAEESLVRSFRSFGPVRAIGKPGDVLAVPGAARMYLGDDEWKQTVLAELRKAEAVVLMPGLTEGVQWELNQIGELVELRRLLLCLASFLGNPQGYEEMSRIVRKTLQRELPRVVPFLNRPAFVYFDRDGAPLLQELSYKCPVLWPVTADATDLKYTLKPFLEGINGDTRLRPRTARWTPGLGTWAASIAAAALSLALAVVPVWAVGFIAQRASEPFQSWTTLRGRTVPYSLSIPASMVQIEMPSGVEMPSGIDDYGFQSPDGNFSVAVSAGTTRENVSSLGEQSVQFAQNSHLYSEIRLESTNPVELAGEKWMEARLLLTRKDNGNSIREKARLFSDDRGTILIRTFELVEWDSSSARIAEKILASVRLDSPPAFQPQRPPARWPAPRRRVR